jgi:hypothetical protein
MSAQPALDADSAHTADYGRGYYYCEAIMQDDFDNDMGMGDDEDHTGGSAMSDTGDLGGGVAEGEAEGGEGTGRRSGGARARKSSAGSRKSAGGRKAKGGRKGAAKGAAKKAARKGKGGRKGAAKGGRKGAKKKGGRRR